MLVYIDVASHINRREFDGSFFSLSSFFSVKESWKEDFFIFDRGCSHSVIRFLKGCKRLLQYDTTGRFLSGILWTLKMSYKKPHGSSLNLRCVQRIFFLPC